MSEYAQTGIYIDPNQITRKLKPKKKSFGRDIKYSLNALETASSIGLDDFFGGGLQKKQKIQANEEQVEDMITDSDLKQIPLSEQARRVSKKKSQADEWSFQNFNQNLISR